MDPIRPSGPRPPFSPHMVVQQSRRGSSLFPFLPSSIQRCPNFSQERGIYTYLYLQDSRPNPFNSRSYFTSMVAEASQLNPHLLRVTINPANMDSEVSYDCLFFKAYKDGRVHVYRPIDEQLPPSDDPLTGVRSKDVAILPDIGLSARIYLPKVLDPNKKLPLLFYIHGGGFCMCSAFAPNYHNFLNRLVAEGNVIAISVEYGLYPTRPIAACYDDSWAALQWVATHANGNGPDPWLNNHADFNRVFIGGDSAGGNISHTLTFRAGSIGLPGVKVVGAILVHPYFGGTEDDQMWLYMCPTNEGLDDPRLKPAAEDLARLGCGKVLMFLAEKDHLFEPGMAYYERLKSSGWKGTVEIVENEGEGHGFHLDNLDYEKAVEVTKKFASFMNQH